MSKAFLVLEDGTIYNYDKIFVTDLCLEDPVLSKIANDKKINSKLKEIFTWE